MTEDVRARGRPRELTPDVQAKIVAALEDGNFRETAAMAAGVNAQTLRRWLKLGAHGEEPYASFAAACDAAEATAEASDIRDIGRAGREDWKALAWRQERKASSRWGLRVKLEVDQELSTFLDRLEKHLPPDLFQLVLTVATGEAGEAAPLALGLGDEPAGETEPR